jgi:predicted lipoprotein with Yx(FWY)xxD motif
MRKTAFVLALSILGTSAFAATPQAPLATPPGVTFQSTRTGVIYADVHGKTLYTADADCTGDCTQTWKPVVAGADAKAFGDWSITTRADGSKQWALNGKQLYTSAKDEKPGDAKGVADGWRVAAFQAPVPVILPPDIGVHEAPALPGQVLVSAEGHTLYTGPLDCTAKCAESWTPVVAPAIANVAGDFSALKRKDGSRQWAYKGGALYTFAGDLDDGDVHGVGVDPRFQAAALSTYFMPAGVAIRTNPDDAIHPFILADANGRTLYAREHWLYTQTFHAKNGDRNSGVSGRGIGANGCTDDCLKRWKPLAAPADAVGSGHWNVVTREDGSKQWAYQNFALYTYMGDEKPGDTRGNERFDLWEKDVVGLPPPMPTSTASVMYWRAASP